MSPSGDADPGPGGLLSVEGAPNVTLSTVKPAGNPLAAGLPGAPSRTPCEVTVRLRETDGRAAVAELRLAAGIETAWVSDLLEERHGAALPPASGQPGGPLAMRDGAVLVAVRPFETVTLRVRLTDDGIAATAGPGAVTGERPEPAQPVYARYWLHGKGPAPAGNVPVAVHFSPTRVTLGSRDAGAGPGPYSGPGLEPGLGAGAAGGPTRLTLTVACGPAGGSGEVELVVPAGLTAAVTGPNGTTSEGSAAAGGPLRYDLGPDEFASWDVTVSALSGAADGRYFLTARIGDELGQLLEDTALVTIGEAGGPDPGLEPEELFTRLQSDVTALADEVAVTVLTPAVQLGPGESGELAVRVTSRLASQLRGEMQLVSPVGTWPATTPWTQPVTVEPGGEATLRFAVSVPGTAVPGWESWLLVKLMYFGRVRYSEAVRLTVA